MRGPKTPFAVAFIEVWIICSFIAALLVYVLESGDRTLGMKLHDHGATALATVTRTDPSNHNTVYYRFVAKDGKTYPSSDRADGPDGEASRLSVGSQIHIVYDTKDPNVSCDCVVSDLLKSSRPWSALVSGAFISSIISVVIALRIQRRRRSKGRPGGTARRSTR